METEPEQVATAGISALRERWGDDLVFGRPEVLSGSGRSVVLRLPVSGPAAAATVIVKGYTTASPTDTSPDPMENEVVAATLFGDLPGPAVGPALLAVDLRSRVLVLSDLGSHPAVSDLLLAADPAARSRRSSAGRPRWVGSRRGPGIRGRRSPGSGKTWVSVGVTIRWPGTCGAVPTPSAISPCSGSESVRP